MIKLVKKLYKKEKGQALVFVAILMAVLLGFAAIAIDFGVLSYHKRLVQNIADAAALAGAQEIYKSEDDITRIAIEYAKLNGLKADEKSVYKDGDLIEINKNNNEESKLEVEVTRKIENSFAKVFGFNTSEVYARAVAQKENNNNGLNSKDVIFSKEDVEIDEADITIEGTNYEIDDDDDVADFNNKYVKNDNIPEISFENFKKDVSNLVNDAKKNNKYYYDRDNKFNCNKYIEEDPIFVEGDFNIKNCKKKLGPIVATGKVKILNRNNLEVESITALGKIEIEESNNISIGKIESHSSISIKKSNSIELKSIIAKGDIEIDEIKGNSTITGMIYSKNEIEFDKSNLTIKGKIIGKKIEFDEGKYTIKSGPIGDINDPDLDLGPNRIKLIE